MIMKQISIRLLALLMAGVSLSAFAAENDGSTKVMRNLVVEGNKLFGKEQYHRAIEAYDKALAANPSYQYAQYNKAVALVQLATDDNKGTENDPRQKAAELFAGIAQVNTNPALASRSFYNLGNMAFNDQDYAKAINMYKGSLRINPDNRECRQNLLLALQKQQEQEQNKDNKDKDKDKQEQEQQQDQQQQQQDQQQQQEQQQQQPRTQSAEQLLQAMQNKENATRRKADRQQQPARRYTDKPW